MEQPTPLFPNGINNSNHSKQTSNTISLIGFCFSLFVFLLVGCTMLAIVYSASTKNEFSNAGVFSLISLALLIGIPIGLTGSILSIVGLVRAASRGGKKWIGISGLIFSGLTILCIIVPLMISAMIRKEPVEVKLPETEKTETRQEKGVLLVVDGYQMKCYDNRDKNDNTPYEMQLEYTTQIKKELDVWFKMHNVEKNEAIILKISQDTSYSQVADLIEALNRLKMTNFQLMTSLKNS